MLETVEVTKLVHGGQGLGVLKDGRKVFVWDTLPGETVRVRLVKKRRDYCEGIAEEIVKTSPERITPEDQAYLSTSPWQMMSWLAENKYKQEILKEVFIREKVVCSEPTFSALDQQLYYRNKMEYSFWADEAGLHLALFNRGSHHKQIVNGSSIARPEVDEVAQTILRILNKTSIRGSQLKTLVIRCNQSGDTVAALFVKDDAFPKIQELAEVCRGVAVCYSNPKSPASVLTKKLYQFGDVTLVDTIMGKPITYDVHSFFQVNLPVFELTVQKMKGLLGSVEKVDLYCGVGTIGLAVGGTKTYVDVDKTNCYFARQNVGHNGKVVETSSEQALDNIVGKQALIVDPPRAGLHNKLVDRINEVKPPIVAYLSCNPSTQARDIKLLEGSYQVKQLEGYNFFPRTPHIESLAVMIRR